MDQKDQTNGGKTLITLTPTWAYMAQVMTEALVNGTAEGSTRAREEIVSMGERLDELKTYVEEKDKEFNALFDDLERQKAYLDDSVKTIAELRDEVYGLERQLAMNAEEIENLKEFRSEQIKYYDERNILREGTPKLRNEEPIHDELVDFLHASEFGRKHKLDEKAVDLVAVREFVIHTLNQNAKHREENAELEEVGA